MLMDKADNEKGINEPVAEDYSSWDEIDNIRYSLFLGGWITRRLRETNTHGKRQDRKECEKKKNAEPEGREYKSPLQLELEAVAREREEKERLKEAKRKRKEARRRG